MAFWSCQADKTSRKHTHPFTEYMVGLRGRYIAYIENEKHVLDPGKESVKGMLLTCPLARHETRFAHAPRHGVLERDDALKRILSAEDQSWFEPVSVRQTGAFYPGVMP